MWSSFFKYLAIGAGITLAAAAVYLIIRNWPWITQSIRDGLKKRKLQSSQVARVWLLFEFFIDETAVRTGKIRVRLLGQLKPLELPAETETTSDAQEYEEIVELTGDLLDEASEAAAETDAIAESEEALIIEFEERFVTLEEIPDQEVVTMLKEHQIAERDMTHVLTMVE